MPGGGAVALFVAVVALVAAAPAMAAKQRFERIAGVKSPGTPAKYDKVGVLEFGSTSASNVLILNPGTSASAAYFAPLARTIVSRAKDWQVWAVERRENLLEDHSRGHANPRRGTRDDPNSAAPKNDFVARLLPFLRKVARG